MTSSAIEARGTGEHAGHQLQVNDVGAVPDQPPDALVYRHRPHLGRSVLQLFTRADVIFTLAERDIRAQYKQAILGLGWALVSPLATLVIFTLVFARVSSFHVLGEPYILFAYIGILAWGFFAAAVAGSSGTLLANKQMMAKTHFPRECFPLAQVLEAAFTTTLACVPLVILFVIKDFVPKPATLWVPVYVAVEIPFVIGAALIVSSVIIQMRDLNQVVPIFLPLAMLATPVIWPFAKIPEHLRVPYSLVNPLGPVIDGLRGSVLLGHAPDWSLLGVGLCGSLLYFIGGYWLFKRLEVSFADLA
jgi:lipopolysaccharide transport system permease protein